ncbi:MAG: sulfate ABC transporter permease subunit CysT [Alphaproteobacteria bacterium]
MSFKKNNVLPGFWPCFTYTIIYLFIIVILPLSGLIVYTMELSFDKFISILSEPRVISSFKLTLRVAFLAAIFNSFLGLIISWVLVRYKFFGKKIIDAMIDLPFALPTAIAGIALTNIYAQNGLIGKHLTKFGLKIAFTPLGIILALMFVSLPFVVRTLEPILQDFDSEVEEAAASLGASRFYIFVKIILPNIMPAILTGFALAFARGLSEYGSVIFIAGNIPKFSEIVPLVIITKLEQYDYNGATAIALVMLIISFILLLLINMLQKYSNRHNIV